MSRFIAAIITEIVNTLITNKTRNTHLYGRLRYGWTMLVLGCLCLALAAFAGWAFFHDEDAPTDPYELIAIIGLFFGFGAASVYVFAEYFLTKGTYDDEGITFYAPLTGHKSQKWSDLTSAKYSDSMKWYVLKFRDGKIIRISEYLYGHGGVLDIINKLDHQFEHFDDDEDED